MHWFASYPIFTQACRITERKIKVTATRLPNRAW